MRADRVVSMMLLLEHRGRMSAAELASELGVSRRTVMRDLEALALAGVPVYSTRGPNGGFRISEGFRSALSAMTSDEAASLSLLGAEPIARLLGLGAEAARVRLRLMQALPPGLANDMETVHQRFFHDPAPWGDDAPDKALAFFTLAIRRRRVVRTRIADGDEVEIRPLGLVLKAGEWYLAADQAGRVSVAPVRDLNGFGTTGERFPYPEDFDLEGVWRAYVAR